MEKTSLRDIFGDYLVQLGGKNENVVVLDADLSSSTRTSKFAQAFPERFFNIGIAEQNMVGIAMGFAISDKIPIVSGFSIFTTGRAWEFIRLTSHDNLNIKFITTHGGLVGKDGSTHHALEDLSLTCSLPNMNVLVPSDNVELVEMLNFAIKYNGPFYIRLPRESYSQIHDIGYKFKLGAPDVLNNGKDICLIGTGYGTHLALEAANLLKEKIGISSTIINLSSIKPILTKRLIELMKNVKGIVIIEEHNIYCGVGSIIARIISEKMPKPMKVVGVNDTFSQSGEKAVLLERLGLTVDNVIKNVKELLKSS